MICPLSGEWEEAYIRHLIAYMDLKDTILPRNAPDMKYFYVRQDGPESPFRYHMVRVQFQGGMLVKTDLQPELCPGKLLTDFAALVAHELASARREPVSV